MSEITEIIQSPLFARQKKKLHKNQIRDLDKAIRVIAQNPEPKMLGIEEEIPERDCICP